MITTKTIDKNSAIGIFDSGVGGLSIAQCIRQHLPYENIIYIADQKNAPYGEKSIGFIIERVNIIADALVAKGVKAIVIACNTATVNAIDQLRARLKIPVIGVEPAIKPAVNISKSKKIAILVTQATADNKRFLTLVSTYSDGIDVFITPCPGLVELVEQAAPITQGDFSNNAELLLHKYLTPLLKKDVDTIVLGCTHYPFLIEPMKKIIGSEVTIVETSEPVTKQLIRQLKCHQLTNDTQELGKITFYSSAKSQQQQQLISNLWQSPVQVKLFER